MKVLLLVPGLYDRKGGIQTFSRFFRDEIEKYAETYILSLHDVPRAECTLAAGRYPQCLRKFIFASYCLIAALRYRPDVIVSTHIHFAFLAIVIKAIVGGRVWLVAHGVEAWEISKSAIRYAVRHADKVLAVSRVTRDRMIARGYLAPGSCQVFYNRADESRFTVGVGSSVVREKLGISGQAKVLLSVCRLDALEKYKGYDTVLRALSLIEGGREIIYVLVGDGSDRQRVETLVSTLALTDRVRTVGEVSDDDLVALYQLADLFIMPSKGEGFGIVYVEAAMCGVRSIAGDSDGAKEAVYDERLGVCIDPGSVDACVSAIRDALNALPDREVVRELAITQFGAKRFAQQVKDLVLECGSA